MKTIDLYQQKITLTNQFNPLSFHFYAYKVNQGKFIKYRSILLCLGQSRQPRRLKNWLTLCLIIRMILLN